MCHYFKKFLLFIICLIGLCGCSHSEQGMPPPLSYTPQASTGNNLRTIDVSGVVGEGYSLGCITSSKEYIFYESCQIEPITSNYMETIIYQLDINTSQSEPIIHISNGGDTFFSNELIHVDDSLFWVYRDENEVRIDFYTLSTGIQGTLIGYPPSSPDLILSGDNRFLTWYMPNEIGISLLYFDSENDTIKCLTKNAAADSPYTRAYVFDGMVSFLENQPDSWLLIIYNLIDQKAEYTCHLSKDFLLTRLQTNSNYTICTDGYSRNSSLYLLNKDQQEFEKIEIKEYDYNIFACHLYKDCVIVNSNLTKSILSISLKSGISSFETSEENILQSMISPDGLFYGCNPSNKIIYVSEI